MDFCFDSQNRLIFVELGKTLFIKKPKIKRQDSSYLYSKEINGYGHNFLKINNQRDKLYFRAKERGIIMEIYLRTLDDYNNKELSRETLTEIKEKIEEDSKHLVFLLLDDKEGQECDKICQFEIDEFEDRIILITWKGLLQIKYFSGKEGAIKLLNDNKKQRNDLDYEEYYEGLSVDIETGLIAISSVKMHLSTEKFFENTVYLFKNDRNNILELQGKVERRYSPSDCNYLRLKFKFIIRLFTYCYIIMSLVM